MGDTLPLLHISLIQPLHRLLNTLPHLLTVPLQLLHLLEDLPLLLLPKVLVPAIPGIPAEAMTPPAPHLQLVMELLPAISHHQHLLHPRLGAMVHHLLNLVVMGAHLLQVMEAVTLMLVAMEPHHLLLIMVAHLPHKGDMEVVLPKMGAATTVSSGGNCLSFLVQLCSI